MAQDFEYRSIISREFAKRRGRNAYYSLRAFARDLGVSPSTLSEVLSQKRDFSKRNALKVADRLELTPSETQLMLNQLGFNRSEIPEGKGDFFTLRDEVFEVISDWYHYGILNLAKLPDNRSNPAWIGQRLGISPIVARDALKRLERLKLLQIFRGKMKRIPRSLTTFSDVPSAALRRFQKQNLELAKEAIETVSKEKRNMTSVTMAVNPQKLPEAIKMIENFRVAMANLLEEGACSEVYTLAVQLFPLTQDIHKEKRNDEPLSI